MNWGVGDAGGVGTVGQLGGSPLAGLRGPLAAGGPLKACLERRCYVGLRLSHFGICNSPQQRGWGQLRGVWWGRWWSWQSGAGWGVGCPG